MPEKHPSTLPIGSPFRFAPLAGEASNGEQLLDQLAGLFVRAAIGRRS